jgi:hypothetical protein
MFPILNAVVGAGFILNNIHRIYGVEYGRRDTFTSW